MNIPRAVNLSTFLCLSTYVDISEWILKYIVNDKVTYTNATCIIAHVIFASTTLYLLGEQNLKYSEPQKALISLIWI